MQAIAIHLITQFYSNNLAYITAAELDELEFSADNLPNAHTSDGTTAMSTHLEIYYSDTQIQTGGLNPMDFEATPTSIA